MSTWVDGKDQDKVDAWILQHGDEACVRYHTDDTRFALWMAFVDRSVGRMVAIGCMDLEDWGYHDAYSDGMSPQDAAINVLEYNGWAVAQ